MHLFSHREIEFNHQHPAHQDVKLTASNDDYYFVFEDFLYQVSSPSFSISLHQYIQLKPLTTGFQILFMFFCQ